MPFTDWLAWGDGASAADASEGAWRAARDRGRAWLSSRLEDPVVREAIALASPDLDARIGAWRADPDAEPGVEAGLVKYVSRACVRATPFGTFAATSLGALGSTTRLALPARDGSRRHTRLDMDFLSELVARLASDPEVRARVPFAPNSSLYPAGDALRYAEARRVAGARAYFLVEVEANDAVTAALEASKGGATLEAIARALADLGVALEDAREFAGQLADAQLLVADLGPLVTGADALEDLIARLARHAPEHPAHAGLREARAALAALDARGLERRARRTTHSRSGSERSRPSIRPGSSRWTSIAVAIRRSSTAASCTSCCTRRRP